jgi:hypothetical protein
VFSRGTNSEAHKAQSFGSTKRQGWFEGLSRVTLRTSGISVSPVVAPQLKWRLTHLNLLLESILVDFTTAMESTAEAPMEPAVHIATLGPEPSKLLSNQDLVREADGLFAGISYLNQTEQIAGNMTDDEDDDDDDEEDEWTACSMVPEVRRYFTALSSLTTKLKIASLKRRNLASK